MPIRSPKDINKGLEGWYDASETSSLQLSGSNLTGWLDLSTTSSHLDTIQGNAPQLSTRKVNNRTVVEFNNDGAVYRNIQVAGTTFPQATIAFVCVPDAYDGGVVSSRTTNDSCVEINANGTVSMDFSTTGFNSISRCKTGEVTRIIASYNGDSSKIWVNGVATNAPAGLIEDRILIGMIGASGATATNYFDGLVCEAVIYEDALTDSEVQELDWYFQRKWDPFSNKVTFDTSANGYSSTIERSTSATIDVNVPTNVSPGDMMLGVLTGYSTDSLTITPPSGWNVIFDNHSSASAFLSHLWVGYKIANTAEPASYQWSGLSSLTADDQAWIFRITGHDKNNPIDAIGTQLSTINLNGQNINPFNTTKDDSTVVYIISTKNGSAGFAKANGTFVSPVGSTQVVHQKTRVFSTAAVASVAYENKKFAGNTGTKFFTVFETNSAYFTTIGFAIKQAPYSTVQAERLVETGKVKQFSDNFNRADTAVGDLGPNWDIIRGPLRIISNQYDTGIGTVNGSAEVSYAKVSETVVDFSDDHSAQITVARRAVFDALGPAVRVTANGCYVLYCDGGDDGARRISYISGTTRTTIGTVNIPIANGDILKITAQGSVITAYKNGVQIDQVSNTAWTTGQPGIFYDRGNINTSKGDNFVAEDLNSPTSGTMVKMFDDGTIQAGYFSEKEYLDRIKYHFDGDVWAGKFIESE